MFNQQIIGSELFASCCDSMEDSDTGSIEANQQNKNISSLDGSFINAQQPSADDPLASVDLGPISQQEYEAQFFGFTPKSFSDGCK